jgi:hypothetical protein
MQWSGMALSAIPAFIEVISPSSKGAEKVMCTKPFSQLSTGKEPSGVNTIGGKLSHFS